ncbi:MAG: sugar phosphate nucleotidyltransferase [Candidatus Pacebacteria bacterium]|nr:sugar phosphate nucleotidyltransferase [Candidatus Paceibacterota bacterium]MDD2757171.1 sugar phosphate nucleotidyltransferase [Candidatus Paceibacterota bacterium]MDD3283657.1 sugar phosphate nucleotidyltransferase [Candidatus Paceibacterota bacterium]MDD3969719.1 sugar phosphate nucleotidyltransferase [Candidatus Paceibacterota bacterium]MDD4737685.1 sugar phosphate nucleotidyltransferase [Candidatus Paceibacterota bacterium]
MQAIILAAGSGIRFSPFSDNKPKPLFSLFNKSIIEHNLSELKGIVDEVILVVGYKKEMIIDKIGNSFEGIKITYVEDKEIAGTASAVKVAKELVRGDFILLNGDDFYFKDDIKKIKSPGILVREHKNPSSFGVIVKENNYLKCIVEKPSEPVSSLVNTGLYYLSKEILNIEIEKSLRGEYEFTDCIKKYNEQEKIGVYEADHWFPNSYPWDTLNAFSYLFSKEKKEKEFEKEEGASVSKEAVIKKKTIIKSGSYIEGKVYIGENCIIGPNCYIRDGSVIENNCRIGASVEIKNSIIGSGTNISHLSYVGDSIIGENCNLGAGTITANLRHDDSTIKVKVKEKLIDTDKTKLGAIIADNVKTGIGTLIYPGRKVLENTLPGEKVI